jgi:hypothetical protein
MSDTILVQPVRVLSDGFWVDSSTSEYPANGLANLVVGGAGSRRDTYANGAGFGKPIRRFSLFLRAEWAVPDPPGGWIDVVGVLDVKGSDTFRTESRQ